MFQFTLNLLGKTLTKKGFFLSYNSLKRIMTIFSFSSQFLGYNSRILEKKSGFLHSGQGGLPSLTLHPTPLHLLSGPTTKKTFFYECLPLRFE